LEGYGLVAEDTKYGCEYLLILNDWTLGESL